MTEFYYYPMTDGMHIYAIREDAVYNVVSFVEDDEWTWSAYSGGHEYLLRSQAFVLDPELMPAWAQAKYEEQFGEKAA